MDLDLGEKYFSKGEYDKSLEYYFKSLNIQDKIFGINSHQSSQTLNNIGNVYHSKGEYDKSLEYYFKSLNIRDKIFGSDSHQSSETLNNIGRVYHSKGEYDKSLEYYFKSLNITDKIFGSDSHQSSQTLNNIGDVYHSKGEYDKSLEYLFKSLNIKDKIFGSDSHQSSETLHNIGRVYFSKGELDKSLEYFFKSLNIKDKIFGINSHQSSQTLNGIGCVYSSKGELDKSLEYLIKSLNIKDKIFGSDSHQSSDTLNNIGAVYHSKGEYDKSLEYFFKSLNIRDKIFGSDSHQSSETLHNIGAVYHSKREYDKSLEYYFKSLNIRDKIFGSDSHQSSQTLNNIGNVYHSKGEYDKSLEYYFKSLNIEDKIFRSDSHQSSQTLHNIGIVYSSKREYDKSLKYYFKSLNIKDKIFGINSHQSSKTLHNIGIVYSSKGEYDKSLEYFFKSLNIEDKIFGSDSHQSSETLHNIGAVYHSKREYDKSLEYYFKSLNIKDKIFGSDSHQSLQTLNNIGIVYSSKREYAKSLEYYLKSLKITAKIFGINSHQSSKTLQGIGLVYFSKGEYDKSLEYYLKSLKITAKIFGINSHQSSDTLHNIGRVYGSKREYDKSLQYYFKSLNITDKIFGSDSHQSSETLHNIGCVYYSKVEYDKSLEYYFKSLNIFDKIFGSDSHQSSQTLHNIGCVYSSKGEYDKSVTQFIKCYRDGAKTLEKNSQFISIGIFKSQWELFQQIVKNGNKEEILPFLQEQIEWFCKYNKDSAVMVQQVLSTCYWKTGYDIDFIFEKNQSTLNNMETCAWSVDWITYNSSLSVKNTNKMDKDLLIQLFFIKREWNHILVQFHLQQAIEEIEHSISQALILCYNLLDQSFNRLAKLFEKIKKLKESKLPPTSKNTTRKDIYFPSQNSKSSFINSLTDSKMMSTLPQLGQFIMNFIQIDECDPFNRLRNYVWENFLEKDKIQKKIKKEGLIDLVKNYNYRNDHLKEMGIEYFVILTKSEIEDLSKKFMKKKEEKTLPLRQFKREFDASFFENFCASHIINHLIHHKMITESDDGFVVIHDDCDPSPLSNFMSDDKWNNFINELKKKFVTFDILCKSSFNTLLQELPFAYFHDESPHPFSQSWIDGLYHISNDSKHVRLTPHVMKENLAAKYGLIEVKQRTCEIDFAEPLPQLDSWSIYRVVNKNRSSFIRNFSQYHNMEPNEQEIEKYLKQLSRQARYFLRKDFNNLKNTLQILAEDKCAWREYFSKPTNWCKLKYYPVNDDLLKDWEETKISEQKMKDQLFLEIQFHDNNLKKESKHLSLEVIKEDIWYFLKTRISRQHPNCETLEIPPDCKFDVIEMVDRIISKVENTLQIFSTDYQNLIEKYKDELKDEIKVEASQFISERELLLSYKESNTKEISDVDVLSRSDHSSLKQHTRSLLKQSKFSECSSFWIKASELLMDDQPIISMRYLKKAIKSFRFTHDDSEFKKIADLCFKQFQHFNSPDSKDWKMAEYMLQLMDEIPLEYRSHLKPNKVQLQRKFYKNKSEMFDSKMDSDLMKQLQYCQKQIDYLQWLGWKSFHGDHSEKNIHKGSVIVSQLVVNLRHLLDQGITRFARKCIGIPNGTFIPQFNFEPYKQLEKKDLLEKKATKKKLSDYPEIKTLVEHINTSPNHKTIVSISNRFKHVCLDIPLKEDYEEFFSKNKASSFPVLVQSKNTFIDAIELLNVSATEIQAALEQFHAASLLS